MLFSLIINLLIYSELDITNTHSPRFRYMMKRGYLQYLMTNPLYGYHISSAIMNRVMSVVIEEGTKSKVLSKQREIIIAMSPQGFHILDMNWELLFSSPLWDVESIKIIQETITSTTNPTVKKNKELLALVINGMSLQFYSPTIHEQYNILSANIFEALGRGVFPHGTEGGNDIMEHDTSEIPLIPQGMLFLKFMSSIFFCDFSTK